MKLKTLLLGLGLLTGVVFAQETSKPCRQALSLGYGSIQSKEWDFAIKNYLEALTLCPDSEHTDTYNNLLVALASKHESLTDATAKKVVADSVVMFYQRSMDSTTYNVETGAYLASFLQTNQYAHYVRIDTLFSNYIASVKEKTESGYGVQYYVNLYTLYSNEQDEAKRTAYKTRLLEEFLKLSDYNANSGMAQEHIDLYAGYYESYFLYVAKECSDIIPVVKTKIANLPTDKAEKKKVVESYMKILGTNCSNTDEYAALLKISVEEFDPTPESKYAYGQYLYDNGKRSEGIDVMKDAVEMNTDAGKKSEMGYAVLVRLKNSGSSEAFSYAKTIGGPKKGEAIVIQAKIIASRAMSCGTSTFDRKANYWLAIDYLEKAKAAGASVSSLINDYCDKAPSPKEVFSAGKSNGDSIQLTCWGQSTKVRKCN